jgi:hypothetical protein
MRNGLDIQTTSGNVGSYKNAGVPIAEITQCRFTLWLRTVRVNTIDAVFAGPKNV